MKHMIKMPVMLIGLIFLLAGTTQKAMAQNDDVSLQTFYDELSPYGQWIQDPQYGYVWRPDVDQEEFRPYYTNGRWAMTEYGNTWVSNYDWGWAPFHYGRWVFNRYNNWVWIPDTVWGPAWVSWRSGGGYYGWAPLGPSISIGINIGRSGYRIPDMCWNFVPYNNIYYSNYPRYHGSRNRVYIQNTVIINNTYVRNNRTYYSGPRIDDIRRATNQNVIVYNLNRGNRPGASRIDNNTVNIYNPRPTRGAETDNRNAAPRNAVQGNINRGTVAGRNSGFGNRDNNTTNRPERSTRMDDVYQNNRNGANDRGVNGNMATRPTRDGGVVANTENLNRGNGNLQREAARPNEMSRGGDVNRDSQRSTQNQQMSRGESSRENNVQRVQPQQQRMERPQATQQTPQRVERQQQAPQRMERQQSAPQRVERTQSAPQRSSGGSDGRGNSGGRSESGRPSRGGR
jgi:hypothetical protein